MTNKYCTHCGRPIGEDFKVCPYCGNKNENSSSVEEIINPTVERGYFDVATRRKSALISVLFYIAAMYVLNIFIQVILISVAPMITGVDLYFTNDLGEKIIAPENEEFINSWTQILVYLTLVIGLIVINLNYLKEDIFDFKKNFKRRILEVPIGFGIFYGVSIASSILMMVLQISDSSANQSALETIVAGKYGFIVLFTIIILGPICEELIFRQSAFRLFKRGTNAWTKIILTGVIFGSIHVTSAILMYFIEGSFSAIPKEFILGIPYILQGIALSYVYYRSNENIIPVTIVHILNNLIAGIIMFLPQ